MNIFLNDLAHKYKIKLKLNCDINNGSYIAGNDEIFLGKYDNDELMLISFFHEIGHKLISMSFIKETNYNTLLIELECWNIGLKEALSHDVFFSDRALKWGYKQALSYVGHDEREHTNWKKDKASKFWINKKR